MKYSFILFIALALLTVGCKKNETPIDNTTIDITDTLKETGGSNDPIASINETPEIVLAYASPFTNSILLDMPPAKNQGNQGSCSAWATVYYLHSYLKHIAEGSNYSNSTLSSPSYTFNQLKRGNCGGGSGAIVHLTYLKNQGACSLADMPYTAPACDVLPTDAQKTKAAQNKISQYFKINRHNDNLVKTILNLELPIVMPVSSDRALHQLPANNIWIPDGVSPAGHMVTMCGYTTQGYTFINSWGNNWGNNGKFYIPYTEYDKFPNNDGFTAFWASNPALDNLAQNKQSEYLLNGNANNTSTGSNGTSTNATATNNRKNISNSAVQLSGNNSFLSLTEAPPTSSFSVSLWFNKTNTSLAKQTILSQVNQQTDANNNIEVYLNADSLTIDLPLGTNRYKLTTDSLLQANAWYHLVYTYDGKFLRFYLNGRAIKFAVYMSYFKNTNNALTLGCSLANSSGNKTNFFNGKIDDARFYSRAIKETEVDKLFTE